LTQDTSQYFDPDYREESRDLFRQWSEKISHLGKYDYYSLGSVSPRVFFRIMADDLRFIHSLGAAGAYSESCVDWSVMGVQMYVSARMLWDIELNEEDLFEEFRNGLFGAAAEEMQAYYETLERYWTQPRDGMWFSGLFSADPELRHANGPLIDEAWEHLNRAAGQAEGVELERIEYIRDRFVFAYSFVKAYTESKRFAERALESSSENWREFLDEGAVQSLRMLEDYDRVTKEVIQTDPLYKNHYFHGSYIEGKNAGLYRAVRGQLASGFRRLLETGRENLQREEYALMKSSLAALVAGHDPKYRIPSIEELARFEECPPRSREIVVDGDLSEWEEIAPRSMYPAEDKEWQNERPGLEGAFFKVCWDSRALYFAAEVIDREMRQTRVDGSIWEEDCVQLAVDASPREDSSDRPAAKYCSEFGFALTSEGPLVWRWIAPEGKEPGRVQGVSTAVERRGDRTYYEAALPWNELSMEKVEEGEWIGLSVSVNDAGSQSGRRFLAWGGGILGSKNPALHVPLVLAE
jgi:hypothetical protein